MSKYNLSDIIIYIDNTTAASKADKQIKNNTKR